MKYWDKSITLVEGCTPVSEGCQNCWSADIYNRFRGYQGQHELTYKGKWTGKIHTRPDRLPELLKGRKPRVIQIWNDLLHKSVDIYFINRTLDAMVTGGKLCDHQYLILTKRADRLSSICDWWFTHENAMDKIPDNIWTGVTTENQRTADERIPYLLQVPGKRWLSVEPLLSEVNLTRYSYMRFGRKCSSCTGTGYYHDNFKTPCPDCKTTGINPKGIDQVIVGCETGPHARPCKVEWIQSIVDQCKYAGVPCFVKAININGKITSDINKFPESLRVRELAWK